MPDTSHAPARMWAVVTTGNGGYDKLAYKHVPTPAARKCEVLNRVLAAGMNNTEINTGLGCYSSSVSAGTSDLSSLQKASAEQRADGGWNEATPFPIIQGTDCCGLVVALGEGAMHHFLESGSLFAPSCAQVVSSRWKMSGWRRISTAPSQSS